MIIEKLIAILHRFTPAGRLSKKMGSELNDFILSGVSVDMIDNKTIGFEFDTKDDIASKVLLFTKLYAQTMQNACRENDIENYLEINLYDLDGNKFSLALVKHDGKSPHEIRKDLEHSEEKVIKIVNNALYFDDGSGHETALWEVLALLRPELFGNDHRLITQLKYIDGGNDD